MQRILPWQRTFLPLLVIVCVACAFLLEASPVFAYSSIVHVAPSGADSPACGSPDQPCASIEAGLERIVNPATGRYAGEIRLAAGTYTYPSDRGSCIHLAKRGRDPARWIHDNQLGHQ
jgi:hypothetical protein